MKTIFITIILLFLFINTLHAKLFHLAELDGNNIVFRVIVVEKPTDVEAIQWCVDKLGGIWITTSYDGSKRGRYAGKGFKYDIEKDMFIGIKPFNSWILDESGIWNSPRIYPQDGKKYKWNESTKEWILIN